MISKEVDRVGLPVALVTAMYPLAEQVGASRIVKAVKIPHPCGDPTLPPELDAQVRRVIVETALKAIQTEVSRTTVFFPALAMSG